MRIIAIIIAISWISFWTYWIISATKSKKNTKPNIRHFVAVRIVLLLLAVKLVLLFNHKPYTFQNRVATKNELTLVIWLIIFLLGLLLAIWARRHLGKNWGMPMTEKQNPELVTSGPYRYIRHPIYTGILTAALASTIDVSIYWLLVFIIWAIYFIYSAVIEEKRMSKQFPKDYPAYKAKTKMLIPFIF